MRIVQKRHPVLRAKALTDADQPGTFEALISVFDVVDSDGDLVPKGAFADSLAEGFAPVVWSHDWLTPPIGATLDMAETDEGLWAKARFLVADDEDVPLARHCWAAMKAAGGDGQAALREFSWGGRVTDEHAETRDGETIYVLDRIELAEYGPCLRGANPETRLIAVKADVVRESAPNTSPPRGGATPEQRLGIAELLLP